MAEPDGELTVAERLGRALDRGLLPAGGPAEAAERLIERLERPARLALLGLPGAGKSSILNLLTGAQVVPETLRLPTIIVQHGAEARMVCTLTDGTNRIVPGSDLADVLPLAPALVTLEMDLPALKVISLLEVSAGPMEAEQRRAATWASKRADIVIWCTTSYLPKEQAIWESLPDGVKDNSFMFLTKVDLLGSRESASAMHNRVEQRAAEEFRQILSVSARQARMAAGPGGQVNRDLFRDSGALAVIGAIKTRVQSGRRADVDTAELLLARHVEASELVAKRFAEPGEVITPVWTPPPEAEIKGGRRAKAAFDIEPEAASVEIEEAEADLEETAELEDEVEVEDDPDTEPDADTDTDTEFEDERELEVEEDSDDPEEAEQADDIEPEADETEDPDEVDHQDEPEPEEEPEPEPEPLPEPEPEPSILAETVSTAVVEEAGPATRKRFADRIKRVASPDDAPTAPLVPLRSTWKSKTEVEPPAAPEPVRAPEPTRRPRAAAAPPAAQDDDDIERMIAGLAASKDEAPPPREEAPDVVPETPAPVEESPRALRPRMFGGKSAVSGNAERGLPDLSSIRARPDEMEAAESGAEEKPSEDDKADQEIDPPVDDVEPDEPVSMEPEAAEAEPATEAQDVLAPETVIPETVAPEADRPKPIERPRLFDRTARARPAEPTARPPAESRPATAPLSRLPAPPRMPAPAPVEGPGPTRSAADEAQFTPRAIMARDRYIDPEAATPRRERPRIAARAVAAPAAPAVPVQMPAIETALVEEAIDLILTRSKGLQGEIDPDAKIPVDLILDHARETTEQVLAILSRAKSDELRRINGDFGEVLDLIMLMQLEKGHAPADDALTLLLQLRRELETLRAA